MNAVTVRVTGPLWLQNLIIWCGKGLHSRQYTNSPSDCSSGLFLAKYRVYINNAQIPGQFWVIVEFLMIPIDFRPV